jgi:creatinine amidohydrolase
MVPSWATTRYPEENAGHLDFDIEKAKEYTKKKAAHIARTFNEAVERWEMMEEWR